VRRIDSSFSGDARPTGWPQSAFAGQEEHAIPFAVVVAFSAGAGRDFDRAFRACGA
jgi:hypothetical protein